MRPQRGSCVTSIIGANVQCTPLERASFADTSPSRLLTSGSKLAAWARGMGKVVQNPWMTSSPNSSGMPSRDSSTAIRCRALLLRAPKMLRTDPSRPLRAASSTSLVSAPPGPVLYDHGNCCNWPSFSSTVIRASSDLTFASCGPEGAFAGAGTAAGCAACAVPPPISPLPTAPLAATVPPTAARTVRR